MAKKRSEERAERKALKQELGRKEFKKTFGGAVSVGKQKRIDDYIGTRAALNAKADKLKRDMMDSDGDGVADYIDQEPWTDKDVKVNTKGVTNNNVKKERDEQFETAHSVFDKGLGTTLKSLGQPPVTEEGAKKFNLTFNGGDGSALSSTIENSSGGLGSKKKSSDASIVSNVDAVAVDETLGADGMVRGEDGSLTTIGQAVSEKTGDTELGKTAEVITEGVEKTKKELEKVVTETGGEAITNAVNTNTETTVGATDEVVNGNGAALTAINATGGTNTKVTGDAYSFLDDYTGATGVSTLSPEEIKANQLAQQQYRQLKNKNSYEPAIEALGLEQYFPQSNKDIRVGGYQGKNIGSISTYVSRGGTLPFGIVDARRRAIQEQVKAKAALADKIQELDYTTAQQFNSQYIKFGQNQLEEFMKAANYDAEYLNGNNELGMKFRRFKKEYENAGKDVSYIDKIVEQIDKDYNNPEKFVDDETMKLVIGWKEGRLDLDEMFKGEKNINYYAGKFKSYENVSKYLAETVTRIQNNPDEMPITALGSAFDENGGLKQMAADALFKKSGQDYDTYISGVKKFHDISRIEAFVDASFEHNKFYEGLNAKGLELEKQKAVSELISQLSTKVEMKTQFQANKKLDWAKWSFEKEQIKKQNDTPYDYLDRTVSQDLTNIIASEYKKIEAMNLTPTQEKDKKAEVRKRIMKENNNYSDNLSQITGLDVIRVPLTDVELKKKMNANYGQMAIILTESDGTKRKYPLGKWSKASDKEKEYISKKYGVSIKETDDVVKNQSARYVTYERGASPTVYDANSGRYINYNHSGSKAKTRIIDLTKVVISEEPILDKNNEPVIVDGIPQTRTNLSTNTYVIDYDGSDGTVKSNMNNNYEFKKSTERGITTESNQ